MRDDTNHCFDGTNSLDITKRTRARYSPRSAVSSLCARRALFGEGLGDGNGDRGSARHAPVSLSLSFQYPNVPALVMTSSKPSSRSLRCAAGVTFLFFARDGSGSGAACTGVAFTGAAFTDGSGVGLCCVCLCVP